MGYSEILPTSEIVVPEERVNSHESIEPGKILERLPKCFLELDKTIFVRLSDGRSSVEYKMSTFLERSYPLRGKYVKFGSKMLELEKISIFIGLKYIVEDVSLLQDPVD
jgi:hypothetical protein